MDKSKNHTKHKGHSQERGSFSGRIGYVMAVAASAVGLGNIWRFPYLAAQYGGGMFLITYLILMVTFGYVLIVSETALGRMTGKSPVGAFRAFGKKLPFKFGGWINAIVPVLIVPYYCVLGGWVVKYLIEYIKGNSAELAADDYFNNFISNSFDVEICFLIFAAFVVFTILLGVKKGVEKISKITMPILLVLAIAVAIYSVTRKGALAGVEYFLVPRLENFSVMTIVAAMGQLFYSLSLAMGILYTYGSYLGKDVDIDKTTTQIELFDTAIAVLAGLMIIPAVFSFSGGDMETLKSGPSLMFVTMPKTFESMGFGTVVGIVFFILVLIAAMTSAISLLETCVSTMYDEFKINRKWATIIISVIIVVIGTLSACGFGVLDGVKILGMSILDFLDFITNSVMMPIAAIATCVLILSVVGMNKIAEEVEISSKFKRKKLYFVFLKYFAIICLVVVLVSSIANVLGFIEI